MKKYRQENKERLREQVKIGARRWYLNNTNKYLYYQIKNRAKKSKIPFDLEPEDLLPFPTVCPVFGTPMQRNVGGLSKNQDSPSIDRIIPELGYTKNNIQIISMRANIMKNDATPEQLRRFAHWVLKTFPA